jgi:hypothetical protein
MLKLSIAVIDSVGESTNVDRSRDLLLGNKTDKPVNLHSYLAPGGAFTAHRILGAVALPSRV